MQVNNNQGIFPSLNFTTPFSHGLTSTGYRMESGEQGNTWMQFLWLGSFGLGIVAICVSCILFFNVWKTWSWVMSQRAALPRVASSPVTHVDQRLPEESPTSTDPLLTAPSHPESATNVMVGNADQLVDRGNSLADVAPEQAGKPGKVARLLQFFSLGRCKSGQARGDFSAAQQEAVSVFYSQPDNVESPVSYSEPDSGDRRLSLSAASL